MKIQNFNLISETKSQLLPILKKMNLTTVVGVDINTWKTTFLFEFLFLTSLFQIPKNYNVKIVISEVYAFFVLQCTVSGR